MARKHCRYNLVVRSVDRCQSRKITPDIIDFASRSAPRQSRRGVELPVVHHTSITDRTLAMPFSSAPPRSCTRCEMTAKYRGSRLFVAFAHETVVCNVASTWMPSEKHTSLYDGGALRKKPTMTSRQVVFPDTCQCSRQVLRIENFSPKISKTKSSF